jgi:hypothetical protein
MVLDGAPLFELGAEPFVSVAEADAVAEGDAAAVVVISEVFSFLNLAIELLFGDFERP